MADLGDPTSYLQLAPGTPALTRDGHRIGTVEHVLADAGADIFDGLVLDTRAGFGGWRFADATEVDAMYERGVVLRLDAAQAERLPEPSDNPAVLRADPDDTTPDTVGDKLRRAWDWISGRY